jgi:hypothetical protein
MMMIGMRNRMEDEERERERERETNASLMKIRRLNHPNDCLHCQ